MLQEHSLPQQELDEALRRAAYHEHEAVVELLLSYGADPNSIVDGSWSALILAIEQQNENIVRLLARRGANVDLACEGWSPLHNAVDIDADSAQQAQVPPQPVMTRLLLELGANPTAVDREGQRAVDIARAYNFTEAVELLVRHDLA